MFDVESQVLGREVFLGVAKRGFTVRPYIECDDVVLVVAALNEWVPGESSGVQTMDENKRGEA